MKKMAAPDGAAILHDAYLGGRTKGAAFRRKPLTKRSSTANNDPQSRPASSLPFSYQYPNTFHHTIPTVANTSNSTTAITKPTPHHLPMET